MVDHHPERGERNIRTAVATVDKLNRHDFDEYFDVYQDGFTLKADFIPRPIQGIAANRQYLEEFAKVFPDLTLTVTEAFADPSGNLVEYLYTGKGTRTNGFMGLPPTATAFEFHGSNTVRFRNGKIAETRMFWDNAAILQQLKVIPASFSPTEPGGPNKFLLCDQPLASKTSGETISGFSNERTTINESSIIFEGDMFYYNGRPMGRYVGSMRSTPGADPADYMVKPEMPPGPIDKPTGIPSLTADSYYKVTYYLGQGDSITVVGSSFSHITPMADGSMLFMVTAMGLISGGTGRYRGASGVHCQMGPAPVPKGAKLAPGTTLSHNTFYLLQVVVAEDAVQPTSAGPRTAQVAAAGSSHSAGQDPNTLTDQQRRNIQAVLQGVEDLNTHQFDKLVAGFSEDMVWHSVSMPRPLVGRKEVRDGLALLGRFFPDGILHVDQIFASGNRVVLAATQRGRLQDGFLGLPATEKPYVFPASQIIDFDDNGVRTKSWIYWDRAWVLQQLGAMPESLEGMELTINDTLYPTLPPQAHFAAEEIVVGYGIEEARMAEDRSGPFIVANGKMFGTNGKAMGHYQGTMRLEGPVDPRQLAAPLPAPNLPMDRPTGITGVPIAGRLKVTFYFNSADSITVSANGAARLITQPDGKMLFMISAMGLITGGTGQFEGASGVEIESGCSLLTEGEKLAPGAKLPFRTSFELRIVRKSSRRPGAVAIGSKSLETASKATGDAFDPSRVPPGFDPNTFKLATVDHLLRRIANFTFFSMPNAAQPNVPIMADGKLIGVEVHENLHRFEIKQKVTGSGFEIKNAVGQPTAQVHMHWRPIPDDFDARPGVEIPPTPLDPSRSQRFMMHDGHFSLDDSDGSGLRGFGSGRTFPVMVDGKPQLRLAAVVDVLEGLGEVAGHHGLLVVNGYIEPPDGLALCILLRLTDPSGDFAVKSRLPTLRSLPDPDPDNLYLIFLGEPVPGHPVEMLRGADGRMLGARGPQRMRLIDVVYDVKGKQGIRSKSAIGEIVGEMNADAWFDPTSGSPPFPFQTTGGSFSFFGRDGNTIGSVAADMVEGRALPTAMPGAPMPVFRVGGLAPVTSGTGCFRGAVGIFTIDSFISLVPNTISGLFVMHLSDPGGKLRKALAHAWR